MTKILNIISSFFNEIFAENEKIGLSSFEPIKNEIKNNSAKEIYETSIYDIFK